MCYLLLINCLFKITDNKALHISQNMKMMEKLQPEDRYMTAWGLQSKVKRKAEIEVLEAENPPFKTNKVEIKTTELKGDPTKSKKKSPLGQARDVKKGAEAKYSTQNKIEIEDTIGPREFDPGQWDEIAIQRKMEKTQLHENFENVRTELTTKFGYQVTETGLLKGRISAKKSIKEVEDRSGPAGHVQEIWVSGHLRKIWVSGHVRSGHSNAQSGRALVEESSSDAGQKEYPRPSIVLKSGQTGKVKKWLVSIPLVENMPTRRNFPRFIGNLGTVNEVLALIIDYQNWLDHLTKQQKRKNHLERASNLYNSIPGSSKGQ